MNTKFTEGVWQISRLYNTLLEINVNGLSICELDCCGDFNEKTGVINPTKEERANAHLIAAAPDMYALLSKINDDSSQVNVIEIRKILTKARGEL
jgi:hypothetical protein